VQGQAGCARLPHLGAKKWGWGRPSFISPFPPARYTMYCPSSSRGRGVCSARGEGQGLSRKPRLKCVAVSPFSFAVTHRHTAACGFSLRSHPLVFHVWRCPWGVSSMYLLFFLRTYLGAPCAPFLHARRHVEALRVPGQARAGVLHLLATTTLWVL
jgi:hypothetical protein